MEYESLNTIELIDVLKEEYGVDRADNLFHGMTIGSKNYYETRHKLIEFLKEKDKR